MLKRTPISMDHIMYSGLSQWINRTNKITSLSSHNFVLQYNTSIKAPFEHKQN
uniref:Uncharacterized protein n=1 Tax=Anopheles quadriannulatus TaxID=34691 RepID=A0A182XRL6_ANOQN